MHPRNPDFRSKLEYIFGKAPFISELGIQVIDCGAGWCETSLLVQPKHYQQDTFVHAGVQSTMADHTAGGAAGTLIGPDETILTANFFINLLRPAIGTRLRCKATVLKPGKTLMVVESEVYTGTEHHEKLTAKATVTLAVVKLASLNEELRMKHVEKTNEE